MRESVATPNQFHQVVELLETWILSNSVEVLSVEVGAAILVLLKPVDALIHVAGNRANARQPVLRRIAILIYSQGCFEAKSRPSEGVTCRVALRLQQDGARPIRRVPATRPCIQGTALSRTSTTTKEGRLEPVLDARSLGA